VPNGFQVVFEWFSTNGNAGFQDDFGFAFCQRITFLSVAGVCQTHPEIAFQFIGDMSIQWAKVIQLSLECFTLIQPTLVIHHGLLFCSLQLALFNYNQTQVQLQRLAISDYER
jgi:hypothetical protein